MPATCFFARHGSKPQTSLQCRHDKGRMEGGRYECCAFGSGIKAHMATSGCFRWHGSKRAWR